MERQTNHKKRCEWAAGKDSLMRLYHDRDWGVPVLGDRRHFEFLILESAQAGLSWRTVLYKRENYRKAFAQFDPNKVAKFSKARILQLLKDPGLIRNRLKIESAVSNARQFLEIQKEFGSFSNYLLGFLGGRPKVNRWKSLKELPAMTPESAAISVDLKKRGFKFLGPVVIYSHLQATGLVNDHVTGCFRYREVSRLTKVSALHQKVFCGA
ncbi:MAG: DNA-3-methyladenine glycosylase I [Candidatus Omnitrophica bacterium]|nr:DNA-3-methyladenine glycosylase I [Candidatus Omnitrophota bacterium]